MKPLKIIVVGTVASDPFAGMAWMTMQITAGFKRLGHDVYYFETTSTWPYDPVQHTRVDNANYAIPYLRKITAMFGLSECWAYRCSFSPNKEWLGFHKSKAEELLANADFVFNISGATKFEEEGLKVGRLVYYGTDPVYHEIKYAQGDEFTRALVDEHDDVVTYGENIGTGVCPIPPLPRLKAKTRQPVLLDYWQNNISPKPAFTTVGNWKQEGRNLEFNGETYYWSKHHEFLKFLDLPLRTSQPIEFATNLSKPKESGHGEGTEIPAFGVVTDDYSLLQSNGWNLADGPSFSMDPEPYRQYIMNSKGEFTFAKDQNIRLQSGWFSERSACYLAAGRPVITQNTGFDSILPTGLGLYSFDSIDDILAALESINSNYEKNSKAAIEIATSYFKAETVLQRLLMDLIKN